MEALILQEQEKYFELAEQIEASKLIKSTNSNLDFDLTNPIKRAQVVVFLGDEASYQQFLNEYSNLLDTKLIIKTNSSLPKSQLLEVEITIDSGVGICKIEVENQPIVTVIIESLEKIFANSLELLICNSENYQATRAIFEKYKSELASLNQSYDDVLGSDAISAVMKNSL